MVGLVSEKIIIVFHYGGRTFVDETLHCDRDFVQKRLQVHEK